MIERQPIKGVHDVEADIPDRLPPGSRVFEPLEEWLNGERILHIHPEVLGKPQVMSPLTRWVDAPQVVSLGDVLDHNHVFEWWRLEKNEFDGAVTRQPELVESLAAAYEILTDLEKPTISDEASYMSSLALLERLLEIRDLATPLIPEEIYNPKPIKQEPLVDITKIKDVTQKNTVRLGMSILSYAGIPSTLIPRKPRGVFDLEDTKGIERVVKPLEFLDTTPHHTVFNHRGEIAFNPNVFIVQRILNEYDQESGRVAVDASLEALSYARTFTTDMTVVSPIGKISQDNKQLFIPQVVQGAYQRQSEALFCPITSITLMDTRSGRELASPQMVEEYLYRDDIGNCLLRLELMPQVLRKALARTNVHIKITYDPTTTSENKTAGSWMGPWNESELTKFEQYPKRIREYMQRLKRLKEGGRIGYQTNEELFRHLSQFLGTRYLIGDDRDAIFKLSDPLDFTQVDRVLWHRRASCEGSNLTFGHLMRYFLMEGEGVAYTQGYVIEDTGRAYYKDRHLKVLYKNASGELSFCDAVAQSAEDFREIVKYRGTITAHQQVFEQMKNPQLEVKYPEVSRLAAQVWQNYERIWPQEDLRIIINSHDFARDLIGFLTYISPEDFHTDMVLDSTGIPISPEHKLSLTLFSRTRHDVESEIGLTGLLDKRTREFYSLPLDKQAFAIIGAATVRHMAIKAAEQNISVITEFSNHMLLLREEYIQRFKNVLRTQTDRIVDIDEFFSQQDFLGILPSPYPYLENFFSRLFAGGVVGGLHPSDPQEIAKKFDERIAPWKEFTNGILIGIADRLRHVPATIREGKVVYVSSRTVLDFWEDSHIKSRARASDGSAKLLDPQLTHYAIRIFVQQEIAAKRASYNKIEEEIDNSEDE